MSLKESRAAFMDQLKKASTLEVVEQAVLPDSHVMKGVEAAAVIAAGVAEYMTDPLGSVVSALMYSGAAAGVLTTLNALGRAEGRQALGELYRRMTKSKLERMVESMSFEQQQEALDTLATLMAGVQSNK